MCASIAYAQVAKSRCVELIDAYIVRRVHPYLLYLRATKKAVTKREGRLLHWCEVSELTVSVAAGIQKAEAAVRLILCFTQAVQKRKKIQTRTLHVLKTSHKNWRSQVPLTCAHYSKSERAKEAERSGDPVSERGPKSGRLKWRGQLPRKQAAA